MVKITIVRGGPLFHSHPTFIFFSFFLYMPRLRDFYHFSFYSACMGVVPARVKIHPGRAIPLGRQKVVLDPLELEL